MFDVNTPGKYDYFGSGPFKVLGLVFLAALLGGPTCIILGIVNLIQGISSSREAALEESRSRAFAAAADAKRRAAAAANENGQDLS